MENYISTLHKSKLFVSVSEKEIGDMLPCLQAQKICYHDGDTVKLPDEQAYVIVHGNAQLRSEDAAVVRMFTESDVLCEIPHLNGMIITAAGDCTLIAFSKYNIFRECSKSCLFHQAIMRNLFSIASDEISHLAGRVWHMAKPKAKEKLISYLTQCAEDSNSSVFEINLTRKRLARYLGLDRAAMTSTLYSLQDEGLIKIDRNRIELLNQNN